MIDCIQLAFPLSEYVNRLSARHPGALFIAIGRESNEKEIPYMLSLGIHGFVPHDQVETSLAQAVERVLTGGVWVPQRALRTQSLQTYHHDLQRTTEPTHREMQVLELVRRRFSNKEVGEVLRIRESTVKYHVSNLLGKLEVNNRTELVRTDVKNDTPWNLSMSDSSPRSSVTHAATRFG
jgi:DNA-binding NarL/FixJ family response regulator